MILDIGTKVMIITNSKYNGRFYGKYGWVAKTYNTDWTGDVAIDIPGNKNPNGITGWYYFKVSDLRLANTNSIRKIDDSSTPTFEIKNVIFNEPATIVFWADGTKTVVKRGDGDLFDPEKGLAMAISKKAMGNKGHYFEEFKKWTNPWCLREVAKAMAVSEQFFKACGLRKENEK